MAETANFLYNLLNTHGYNFSQKAQIIKSVHIANTRANHLERFFGRQARNGMKLMGGIEAVAIALSGIS